jgi:heptosyltransferase I
MSIAPKTILIVLFGAIGDVVRGLSLAVRIKKALPESRISWAIEPKSRGVLEGHWAVDRLVLFERGGGLQAYARFIKELQKERYDVVLDLQRHFKSGISSRLSRGKRRIGFHRKNAKELNWLFNNEKISYADNSLPKIEHYHLFGDQLGLPRDDKHDAGIRISADVTRSADALLAEELTLSGAATNLPFVGMIIGASWESKLWPAKFFVELVSLLSSSGAISVLIGGPAERRRAEEILSLADTRFAVSIAGKTSIAELMAVTRKLRVVIGSDSGPMHIAAALGVPVISLWGATDPMRTGPYGVEGIALRSAIGCSPCYRRECPGLDTMCMSAIRSDAVFAAARRFVS